MKKLVLLIATSASMASLVHAADVELCQQQSADVYNLRLGQTEQSISVNGLSVLDESGVRNVISLGDTSNLPANGVQLSGVLFAILPENGNQVTALIMYQSDPSAETADTLNQLVQDIMAHNGWTDTDVQVRAMNPGETIPEGTQFWLGSSTQALTLNGPAVCVADSAVNP
jgi:hypothetical protein